MGDGVIGIPMQSVTFVIWEENKITTALWDVEELSLIIDFVPASDFIWTGANDK